MKKHRITDDKEWELSKNVPAPGVKSDKKPTALDLIKSDYLIKIKIYT